MPGLALLFDESDEPPASGPAPTMGDDDEGEEEADDGSLPPAFDTAAEEFLDAERPLEERKLALKRAIEACVDAKGAGSYK